MSIHESGPLSPSEIWKVWHEFVAVCQLEELGRAYGWDPSEVPAIIHGERVTAFYLNETLAGWLSLKPLPTRCADYEVVLGVFPEYRCQGLGDRMLNSALTWARKYDVHTLTRVIKGSNRRRLRTLLCGSLAGSPWRYSGYDWYPELHYRFTWVNDGVFGMPIPWDLKAELELRKLDEYEAVEVGG